MIKISLFKLITLSEYLPLNEQCTSNTLALFFPKPNFTVNMLVHEGLVPDIARCCTTPP